MSDSEGTDPIRFRKKAFAVGCVANLILFAALAVLAVLFLFATLRSLDNNDSDEKAAPSAKDRASTPGENARKEEPKEVIPAVDEKAIRAVLATQVEAWNRGDLDGFMTGYWHNDELAFTSGDTVTKGWDATRRRYIKRYRSEGKEMGRLSFTELQIEPLNSTTALVRGRYILGLRDETAPGRFTLVFRKFDDGWKITSDHTSAAEKK